MIVGAMLTAATAATQSAHFAAFARRPWLWPLPAVAVGSVTLCPCASFRGKVQIEDTHH